MRKRLRDCSAERLVKDSEQLGIAVPQSAPGRGNHTSAISKGVSTHYVSYMHRRMSMHAFRRKL